MATDFLIIWQTFSGSSKIWFRNPIHGCNISLCLIPTRRDIEICNNHAVRNWMRYWELDLHSMQQPASSQSSCIEYNCRQDESFARVSWIRSAVLTTVCWYAFFYIRIYNIKLYIGDQWNKTNVYLLFDFCKKRNFRFSFKITTLYNWLSFDYIKMGVMLLRDGWVGA